MEEAGIEEKPYHHGRLRRALIDSALELIAEKGVDALTIRALAERVGVSHAAPQYHFPDKAALLQAVAAEGFRKLYEALQAAAPAVSASADPEERLMALGRAYFDFAFTNPSYYRVIFATRLVHQEVHGDAFIEVASKAFLALVDAVADFLGERDSSSRRLHEAAFFAWSAVHGAVMLRFDMIFPFGQECPDPSLKHPEAEMEGLMEATIQYVVAALRGMKRTKR